ncbi:helix-turn-helix transcriptional regulator [Massilia violaceinigra]|nr:AlpA family phage regulatory protein [Massilia violaceinigra]
MVSLSTDSVQRQVREENFPKPRQIGPRRVAWLMREVEQWAEERPVSQNLPPENTARRAV